MNENIRILLLALGIVAVVASDPPVVHFEQPHSACCIVTNLAVGAFESLVLSTLPVSELTEHPPEPVQVAQRVPEAALEPVGAEKRLRQSFVMTSARRVTVESCHAKKAPVEMLRVDARIEVHGSLVEKS